MRKFMWLLIVAISLPAVGCQSCFEAVVDMEHRKNEWLRETLYGSRQRNECNNCDCQCSGMPINGEVMVGEPIVGRQVIGGQMIGGQVIGTPVVGGCQSCGR